MFIRNCYVTNSSSTSFIFYGVEHGENNYDRAISHLRNIGELDFDRSYEDYEMMDILERFFAKNNPGLSAHFEYESKSFQIYPNSSYLSLYECGVDNLPVNKLLGLIGKHEKEWDAKIEKAEGSLGVTNKKPGWKIAIYIER